MKFILLILLLPINIYAENVDLSVAIRNHKRVLKSLGHEKLNPIQLRFKSYLDKKAEGKMPNRMLNYFAKRPRLLFGFKNSVNFAENYSKKICKINKRPINDEADALRHLLWSSYLTQKFGAKVAFEITALQETRQEELDDSSKMDIFNNYQAISKYKRRFKRSKSSNKSRMIKFSLDLLESGNVKVLVSKKSGCQNSILYPNF